MKKILFLTLACWSFSAVQAGELYSCTQITMAKTKKRIVVSEIEGKIVAEVFSNFRKLGAFINCEHQGEVSAVSCKPDGMPDQFLKIWKMEFETSEATEHLVAELTKVNGDEEAPTLTSFLCSEHR